MGENKSLKEYSPKELADLFQQEAEKIEAEKCQYAVIRATFSGGKGKYMSVEKAVEKDK